MKFEGLQEFDWYNEPENVIFGTDELKVIAKADTDFWQSRHHNFAKDNGHFFFCTRTNNFAAVIKWTVRDLKNFNQAGLMVRIDADNWAKICLLSADSYQREIATFVTRECYTDWAGAPTETISDSVCYKLERQNNDFTLSYSLNGHDFIRVRQFYLPVNGQAVKIGAYICAPQDTGFSAILNDVNVSR